MKTNRFLGSIFLIIGTAMGAGMLALPVSTAEFGFLPSTILFIIAWACYTFTALLFVEVNMWLKPGTSFISMAKTTLGPGGVVFTWFSFLLLLYSLMAAYLSGMGDLAQATFNSIFNLHIFSGWGSLALIILVGSIVYCGAAPVDYLNRFFLIGKIVTFFAIVFFIANHVELPKLATTHFNNMWFALPIVVTSFGFHNVIPSLRVYLQSDITQLRMAVIIGSLIPLILYLVWQLVIVGVVPMEGKSGLIEILAGGQPTTGLAQALDNLLEKHWIGTLFKTFGFFAMSTSFIGISFSLFDFLIDGLNIKRTPIGRISVALLTFIPPFVFAFLYPEGFILALGYAGIFVSLLLGVMPVMMAWSGRYWTKIATGYRVRGGRIPLVIILVFSIFVIYAELIKHMS